MSGAKLWPDEMGSVADAAQWDPTGCICRLDGQLAAAGQRGRFEAAEAAGNLTWFGSPLYFL